MDGMEERKLVTGESAGGREAVILETRGAATFAKGLLRCA